MTIKLLYILYNIFSDEHVCRETKQLNDLYYTHMQVTFTTVNWLLHLAAALCVVLYSTVAVNTTVAVLTLLAGVAALCVIL